MRILLKLTICLTFLLSTCVPSAFAESENFLSFDELNELIEMGVLEFSGSDSSEINIPCGGKKTLVASRRALETKITFETKIAFPPSLVKCQDIPQADIEAACAAEGLFNEEKAEAELIAACDKALDDKENNVYCDPENEKSQCDLDNSDYDDSIHCQPERTDSTACSVKTSVSSELESSQVRPGFPSRNGDRSMPSYCMVDCTFAIKARMNGSRKIECSDCPKKKADSIAIGDLW
ncbi:hypothetical protein MRY87_09815 [bacterium]|nr:hypothetical protein [bacterium]